MTAPLDGIKIYRVFVSTTGIHNHTNIMATETRISAADQQAATTDAGELYTTVLAARAVSPSVYETLHPRAAAFFAAYNGNLVVLQNMMQRDGAPDINWFDPELKTTMLHAAASNGSAEVVKWLLDSGGDAKLLDADGETPLERVLYTCRWEDACERAVLFATHASADADKTTAILREHAARVPRERVEYARAHIAHACLAALDASGR